VLGEVAIVISSATGLVTGCAHAFAVVSKELRLRRNAEWRRRIAEVRPATTSFTPARPRRNTGGPG
jgi:hypothetical protein